MEAKTKTFIKTSVDDNGMWLLTVPAGSAGNETVVVAVRRVEECRYGSEDSPGAHVSITCSLTLYGDGQSTPQTIVAKFEHGRVELFSVEFMLNECKRRNNPTCYYAPGVAMLLLLNINTEQNHEEHPHA